MFENVDFSDYIHLERYVNNGNVHYSFVLGKQNLLPLQLLVNLFKRFVFLLLDQWEKPGINRRK